MTFDDGNLSDEETRVLESLLSVVKGLFGLVASTVATGMPLMKKPRSMAHSRVGQYLSWRTTRRMLLRYLATSFSLRSSSGAVWLMAMVPAPATPMTRQVLETRPSFTPNTPARNVPLP